MHKGVKIGSTKQALFLGKGNSLGIIAPFGITDKEGHSYDFLEHVKELEAAGVNAVQDLSLNGPYESIRKEIIPNIRIPYGTVLTYEIYDKCLNDRKLTPRRVLYHTEKALENQIQDGVDYFTVHASLNRQLLKKAQQITKNRLIPITSRAGGMLIRMMRKLNMENPLNSLFDVISEKCAANNVVISLGSTFRSGCIHDCADDIHLLELEYQGKLCDQAQFNACQVILEGFGHGLPEQFKTYRSHAIQNCGDIPITALGPLTMDAAAGFDDVAMAIGIVLLRPLGLDCVNVITEAEHLSLPTKDQMIKAIRIARIAKHALEVIDTGKNSEQDMNISKARNSLNWTSLIQCSLFPNHLNNVVRKNDNVNNKPCTICGKACPLNERILH